MVSKFGSLALAGAALAISLPIVSNADVRVTSEITSSTTQPDAAGQQSTVTHVIRTYYKGEKVRVDISEGNSYLYDFEISKVYILDPIKKTYASRSLKEFLLNVEPENLNSSAHVFAGNLKEAVTLDFKKNTVLTPRTILSKSATPWDVTANSTLRPETPQSQRPRNSSGGGFPGGGRRRGGGFPFPTSSELKVQGPGGLPSGGRRFTSTDIEGEVWLTERMTFPTKFKHPLLPLLIPGVPMGSIAEAVSGRIEKLKGFPVAVKVTYTRKTATSLPINQVVNISNEVKLIDEAPIEDGQFVIPSDYSRGPL